jgi:tetratricopeptide (TPR) repeat protein
MQFRQYTGCRLLILLVAMGVAVGSAALAQESPIWGSLEAGPYAVGFMATERYDYSRTFQPKRDYFGEVIPGEMARPIQICIWYPARASADAVPVTFGDYAFSPPRDQRFYPFLSNIQNREIGLLARVIGNDQVAILEALGTDMGAVRDAEPAEGTFPLLVYCCNFNSGIGENAVLCEYLASHGFVVATTHSYGSAAIRGDGGPANLETKVGDMEAVLAGVHDLEFVDTGSVGVLGYRAGGLAALLLQMRSYAVDCVVELEPPYADTELTEMEAANPYFDIVRMTVPALEIYTAPEDASDAAHLDLFRYSKRYSLAIADAGFALSTYRLLPALIGAGEGPPFDRVSGSHEIVCRYVLGFFDAHLRGSEESMAFLEAPLDLAGLEPGTLTMSRMAAQDRPPSQDEFLAILGSGDVAVALELYEKFKAQDPDLVLFQEAQMNVMGYRMLQQGRSEEAVALFRINAEAYPQSANCWDSLTEAYMAVGDTEHALECVNKVKDTLPNDTNISDDLRQALETNLERYMEMIQQPEEE